MEIKENTHPLTKGKTYSIIIKQDDDVEPYDIAESFKKQYPKCLCALTFTKIKQIEIGILLIGLNLKGIKNG